MKRPAPVFQRMVIRYTLYGHVACAENHYAGCTGKFARRMRNIIRRSPRK